MSTGWRWVDDKGVDYKSKMDAAREAVRRPEATFEFSELSMAGIKLTDATDDVRGLARDFLIRQ